jgi:hypothetical protein
MPSATSDHAPDRHELTETDPLAAAIASGKDLGVFELATAVSKAREAIPLGSCPRTDKAEQAAGEVRAAFDTVATTIFSIDIPQAVCPCCELLRKLDELIEDVVRPGASAAATAACEELACYAGDDFPDRDATRRVLELARDVFLVAIADRHHGQQ